jgi:hypothetical protein
MRSARERRCESCWTKSSLSARKSGGRWGLHARKGRRQQTTESGAKPSRFRGIVTSVHGKLDQRERRNSPDTSRAGHPRKCDRIYLIIENLLRDPFHFTFSSVSTTNLSNLRDSKRFPSWRRINHQKSSATLLPQPNDCFLVQNDQFVLTPASFTSNLQ